VLEATKNAIEGVGVLAVAMVAIAMLTSIVVGIGDAVLAHGARQQRRQQRRQNKMASTVAAAETDRLAG
jgi:heme exporter protein D